MEAIARVARGVPVSPRALHRAGYPEPLDGICSLLQRLGQVPHRMAVQSGRGPDRQLPAKGSFPPFLATRPLPKGLRTPLNPAQCAQTPIPCACKSRGLGHPTDPRECSLQECRQATEAWRHVPAQAEGYGDCPHPIFPEVAKEAPVREIILSDLEGGEPARL